MNAKTFFAIGGVALAVVAVCAYKLRGYEATFEFTMTRSK